jgi:BR serine/threonine kinase
VNHPNILLTTDVFESPSHLFIVLEYAEQGELFGCLASPTHLAEGQALDSFR